MTVDGALLALATDVAVRAGDTALAGRRSAQIEAGTKSTATDLVTAFDRAAERTIVEGITSARPDDAIVGEEGTNRAGTSGITWFVDPIDGTTNFVYDLPTWTTSVAAADAAGAVVGVVYAPALGELFRATRGGGATLTTDALGEVPIRCSERTEVGLALVATGFGYAAARRAAQAGVLATLMGSIRDVRRFGSAALDLCYTAAGRFDAYYETGLNSWDAAAGELIAIEAGCRAGDHRGGSARPDELLVAAPGVFDALTHLLDR